MATDRDIVATWFVADGAADASSFPQAGHDSASAKVQAIYWRCLMCFHASAVRIAPRARHVLYTNIASFPNLANIPIASWLANLGVEIRTVPIHHRLGRDRVHTWNNQFYILDIINDLAARGDFDTVTLVDSDCLLVRPLDSMIFDIHRHGILSLNIPYTEDFINNGASRLDMQAASPALTGVALATPPHYSGGEIFAATRASVVSVQRLAMPMWQRLLEAKPHAIKIYEEGQFLSLVYELLNIPVGTADPHIRRMWTALRLNNVSAEDIYSSRCLWHLPMEKKTGFADLFKLVCNADSWFWQIKPDEMPVRLAALMGLQKRSLRHWIRQVTARAGFHLEVRHSYFKKLLLVLAAPFS